MSDKVCPFCDEADFDMVGLKIHLNAGDCYAFNDTPGPARTVRLGDARASRPREAGSGAPDEGSKWYTGDGEAFIVLPPNEVRRLRIEAAQSMRAAPVVPITHTVAPEACPECDGARDRPLKRPDAQTVRVTCADPFHTTPASAPAEGGGAVEPGESICEVMCPCCGADLKVTHGEDEGDVSVVGEPATPASAAGRERAREGARQAFYEAARATWDARREVERIEGVRHSPKQSDDAWALACASGAKERAAYNALLAAEAEAEGGAK